MAKNAKFQLNITKIMTAGPKHTGTWDVNITRYYLRMQKQLNISKITSIPVLHYGLQLGFLPNKHSE